MAPAEPMSLLVETTVAGSLAILFALALRVLVELGTLPVLFLQPARAGGVRRALQAGARMLYFIGAPAWLAWRLLAA